MSASRPISVASKSSDAVFPDYEGYGSINTFTDFGTIKSIRMGRCICAPSVKDLLSVSGMAKKGHECILNENNPRMVCKDGTVMPFYYFNDLFYMPYITPIEESPNSGGIAPIARQYVDEADLLSSTINDFTLNTEEGSLPEEAVVRLDTERMPENRIVIDGQTSDKLVARTDQDKDRIVHHIFGHTSHKKISATSAVVDGMPKYQHFNTWCTSCNKGKMHMLSHSHSLWNERAKNRNDVWHIDLVGKFRSPSLGGNQYIVTIIDNYSRYCVAVPIKDKSAVSVLEALRKCIQDLGSTPKYIYTDLGTVVKLSSLSL